MNSPGQLASWVASRVVFGDSPYGHPVSGTPASIQRIQRKDVSDFHARFYCTDNAVLVLGGAVKADDAFKLPARLFGDWAKPSSAFTASATARAEGAAPKWGLVV